MTAPVSDDQLMSVGMLKALREAACYAVEMTLPQETTSPWLGVLRPGRNYLHINTPAQHAALDAGLASGLLVLARRPIMLTEDELLAAGVIYVHSIHEADDHEGP